MASSSHPVDHISMRNRVAATAVVAAASLLILFRPNLRRRLASWLERQWVGDVEGVAKAAVQEKIDILESFAKSVETQLEAMERELVGLQAEDERRRQADAETAAVETGQGSGSGSTTANAAEQSGYYHFSSSGKKFKSKWDSFDVDAALREVVAC